MERPATAHGLLLMASTEAMRRGAREANEESDAARMGAAIGNLAVFVKIINDLTARVEKLEGVHDNSETERHIGGIVINLRPSDASKLSPEARRVLEEMVCLAYGKLTNKPTRSQALRDAGFTRRPSWKSLPKDGDDSNSDEGAADQDAA